MLSVVMLSCCRCRHKRQRRLFPTTDNGQRYELINKVMTATAQIVSRRVACYRHTCLRYNVDNVITTDEHKRLGCLYKSFCVSIIMYADDIVLLSPSVTAVQELLHVCEGVLQNLDLFINLKKSVCMRIGPRYNMSCYDIVSSNGCALQSSFGSSV